MPKSVLTDAQKSRIDDLRNDGFSQSKIADLYGVSQGTISNALKEISHQKEIRSYQEREERAMARGVQAALEDRERANSNRSRLPYSN